MTLRVHHCDAGMVGSSLTTHSGISVLLDATRGSQGSGNVTREVPGDSQGRVLRRRHRSLKLARPHLWQVVAAAGGPPGSTASPCGDRD